MAKSGKRKGQSLSESGSVSIEAIQAYKFVKPVIERADGSPIQIDAGKKCPDVIYPSSAFAPASLGGYVKPQLKRNVFGDLRDLTPE